MFIIRNETMMQYFEWYLPNDGLWWKRCAAKAPSIHALGITQVWLPPAYKATSQEDVGYGVYDMYDVGEFDQKGTVRTKYGTKEEYLAAIDALHNENIKVFADIVLNHRMGGDETETVAAVADSPENRLKQIGREENIRVWSKFNFDGRNGKYSNFTWNHNHFTGTDWAENGPCADRIYRFAGRRWDPDTDPEFGNYDYLMGMNVNMSNPEVQWETRKWLRWYLAQTGADGLRLDAVKHICFPFYRELLEWIREETQTDIPAVGEYWSGDIERLLYYLDAVDNSMSLFDVALHYNFFRASEAGEDFDMRTILDNSLVKERPQNAVTFVDNHDTQNGQSLQSFIDNKFKPLAYALILLRGEGKPCVFYSDYYGNPAQNCAPVGNLGKMIKLRNRYAYGEQEDSFDDQSVVGWVRRGDDDHPDSGMAVLMSNGEAGSKRMFLGARFAGEEFRDVMGNCTEPVNVDETGWGEFHTNAGTVSVWIRKNAFEDLIINE